MAKRTVPAGSQTKKRKDEGKDRRSLEKELKGKRIVSSLLGRRFFFSDDEGRREEQNLLPPSPFKYKCPKQSAQPKANYKKAGESLCLCVSLVSERVPYVGSP